MKQGKIATVVPSRLGSNRIPMKGMRLLRGKTLIEHTITAIKASRFLSEHVFINSDAIEWRELADELGVEFHHRPAEMATSKSMIDDYLYEFVTKVDCDFMAVVTPTAPFVSSQDLDGAWEAYSRSDANTIITAEMIQTHCFYQGKGLNFSTGGQLPRSQDLEPVHAFNFSIAIYEVPFFKRSYEEHGFAVLAGSIETYALDGFSTIDIDEEKDFILAELAFRFEQESQDYQPSYSKHIQNILDSRKDTRN